MTGERVPPANDVNHAAIDHDTLKQWTDDVDLTTSQGFADEWAETGRSLQEAAYTLKQAMIDSESGWSGEAAVAMRGRLGLVALWSGGTGVQLTAAGEAVGEQGSAAERARNAMPEPVPYDPAQMVKDAKQGGLLEMALLPQTLYAQKAKHDAAHEEAVQVVSERDTTMNTVAGNVASFGPPPVLTGGTDSGPYVDSEDFGGGPGGGGPDYGAPRRGGPEVTGSPGPGPGGGLGFGPSPSPSPGSTVDSGQQDTTSPGSVVPREPSAPPVATGSGPGQSASGGTGFGPTGGLLPGGGSGPGGRADVPGGARGPGGAAAPGPGSGRAAPGPVGGPAAADIARGTAGARGPGGLGGVPMGAGRGKGDEDTERQRPQYLQEPDPDSAFDSDVLTAPPVIGGPDDE